MSTIYNINAGFLQSYVTLQSKKADDMTPEEIFKRLSYEMGGDGKTITKSQLNNYLKKAQNGDISLSKEKLRALSYIQKNWDKISNGEDSISYDNLKDYTAVLAMTMAGGFEATKISQDDSSTSEEIRKALKEKYGLGDDDEITKDILDEYLKSLLADEKNTENIDEIAAVTDMIAAFDNSSTVEEQV